MKSKTKATLLTSQRKTLMDLIDSGRDLKHTSIDISIDLFNLGSK